MTAFTAYAALLIFPLIHFLIPEPIAIRWGYVHGRAHDRIPPMPPELKEKAERNRRLLLFVEDILLFGCLYYWIRRYSLPGALVGLRSGQLLPYLLLGIVTALSLRGVMVWISLLVFGSVPRTRDGYFERGSARIWVLYLLVGSFAAELWRAFCLVSLKETGHSTVLAVVVSALFFGAGHLEVGRPIPWQVGKLLGIVPMGIVFGALFLWTNSLMPTYTAHLAYDLYGLYLARRRRPHEPRLPGEILSTARRAEPGAPKEKSEG